MESLRHLTSLIMCCIILYALNATAGNALNIVSSALHHSLTQLLSLRKRTWIRLKSCLVYQTLALPRGQVSRFWRILLALLLATLT